MSVAKSSKKISMQIPAGQTRPVKIPIGKKIKIEMKPPYEATDKGIISFRDLYNYHEINYPPPSQVLSGYNLPDECACFYNEPISGNVTIIVSAVDTD